MTIYLLQDGKQTGPFAEEQVQQMLKAATVDRNILAWKEGMANWEPLTAFVFSTPASALPTPRPERSPLGLTSLIISLVSLVGWLILLSAAAIAKNSGTASPTFNIVIGLLFFVGLFLNFSALVLGVLGAFKSRSNTLAILGACLNAFIMIGLVVLVIIGLAAKHAQQF